MLYPFLRPALFALDPERAHAFALAALDVAASTGLARLAAPRLAPDPVRVMGIDFPNRVGLAAGLDKDAAHLAGLASLGFGFLEAGTVTPRPQPGNPKPRLFRLPEAGALINRLGFNNGGVARYVANVRASGYRGILGCNIGRNAATPNERAVDDYLACLAAVAPVASYVTVNVSSPNTKGLRDLQSEAALDALLARVVEARDDLVQKHGRALPLAIKIAPDLEPDAIHGIARVLVARRVDAAIATNTTIAREAVASLPHGGETGGLSGRPLFARSTDIVRTLARALDGALPIIGVGGILSGEDAREKLASGAALVQLYTGLVYRGPTLVAECVRALAHCGR
ncbi:dihydroorotate dehydrogenase [Burkholderiales bacterium]|nr:dihydroorotate dehydrogenase [Burkholderiales bacterium]